MQRLLYNENERVCKWIASHMGDPHGLPVPSIAVERDGDIVAATCFDAMESNNVYAHIVSAVFPPPISLLKATASYVYEQCAVERMTFRVDESNRKVVDFVEGMGGEIEGRLLRANGSSDTVFYALWKDAPFITKLLSRGD